LPPRLAEQRFPTKQDLDVTTEHPVAFDGSYVWGANTMALQKSGITAATPNPPGGEVVKGADGQPFVDFAKQLREGYGDGPPASLVPPRAPVEVHDLPPGTCLFASATSVETSRVEEPPLVVAPQSTARGSRDAAPTNI
jgi:hypothetical protein